MEILLRKGPVLPKLLHHSQHPTDKGWRHRNQPRGHQESMFILWQSYCKESQGTEVFPRVTTDTTSSADPYRQQSTVKQSQCLSAYGSVLNARQRLSALHQYRWHGTLEYALVPIELCPRRKHVLQRPRQVSPGSGTQASYKRERPKSCTYKEDWKIRLTSWEFCYNCAASTYLR